MFNLTIGGWVLYGFLILCIIFGALWVIFDVLDEDSKTGKIVTIAIALVLSVALLGAFNWYYTSTASGSRAVKTQQSNLDNGIQRTVTVYSATGEIIKEYEGKFDVEYDDDRILFDDENGLRHVIYYPTGTVVIDEVATE